MSVDLGGRLRLCRELAGYETSGEVSRKTSIAASLIEDFEADKETPFPLFVIKLAHTYDVSVDFLIGRTNSTKHGGKIIRI